MSINGKGKKMGVLPELPGMVDPKATENGAWVSIEEVPNLGNRNIPLRRICVRSTLYKPFKKANDKLMVKMLRMSDADRIGMAQPWVRKLYGEHLITDWDMEGPDGQPVEFSREGAIELMNNENAVPYHNFVDAAVNIVSGQLEAIREEDEGN